MSSNSSPQQKHWYVGRTRYFRKEIQMRDLLTEMGVENFVPTLKSRRTRGKGMAEKAAAPNLVFVRTDKVSACALITERHLPMEWMQDCATHSMLQVPDKQMEDFQRVFSVATLEEGGILTEAFAPGDAVQVTEGPLRGVEGNIVEDAGKIYVVVGLAGSVFARAMVPKAWLKIMR